MPFVTFDPERLRLLSRALGELSRQIDACLRCAPTEETRALLQRAHTLADQQSTVVEASLREISTHSLVRRTWPPSSSTATHHRWANPDPVPSVHDLGSRFEQWARETPHWWTRATTHDSTRSDELLRLIDWSSDPGAAGDFIDALSRLELFVLGTADLSTVETILRFATDPDTTPGPVAGWRIRRVLDVIFDDRPWEKGVAHGTIDPVVRSRREIALRDLAARLTAPWQLDFTSRTDWGWTASDGARRLHQMSTTESAANILLSGLSGALQRSLSTLPNEHSARIDHIDSIARAVGTSLEVHRMSDIDRARSDSDLDTLRNVLGTLAVDGPWPASILIDAGARWIGDHFDTSHARIDAATLESLSQREVLASIAMVTVLASSLSGLRRSPNSRHELHRRGSPSTVPPQLIAELRYTYQSIDNAAGRGQSLAQLTGTP